ncbi:MAG: glycosyltransferase [Ktedonobacterales bacterium]|nr:glycosyltransferase [Ktedonobacterales bacterium]
MCFRVAMLSLHTSPLAELGRTRNAGGMNAYVQGLARELGRGGISVDIFTRRADAAAPPIQPLAEQVRLIHIPAGPAVTLPPDELSPYVADFTHRVARFAERSAYRYDLVHSHYWLSGVAGLSLAAAWDVPHITMYHTVERLKWQRQDPDDMSDTARRRIEQERRIAQHADRLTVSTEQEAEQLRRLYGLPASQLRVIPCGVDLRRFTPGTCAQRAAARAALAPDGRPLLLFVGRLDPIKGIDLLLESVARMRTPARLVVIGGNPPGDAEVDRLRARARALGLGERVSFPGAVAPRDLPCYYRAADALAITSRYESFGLVAVEALACGTPVVAAHVGGLPTIVRHGENGMLVRRRCPDAFAEQFDALLEDSALRARLSSAARPSVMRFDWPRIGDRMRTVYQELTAEQRGVAACSCF